MDEVLRARLQSLARHVAGGGGAGIGMTAGDAGPTILGLTVPQWQGLAVFIATLVLAWFDKAPPRQDGGPAS